MILKHVSPTMMNMDYEFVESAIKEKMERNGVPIYQINRISLQGNYGAYAEVNRYAEDPDEEDEK